MACYSNLTELPATTALCSGFKTKEGWGIFNYGRRLHWGISSMFELCQKALAGCDCGFCEAVENHIFSCGEQFGCMWMYSGEGWEYQVPLEAFSAKLLRVMCLIFDLFHCIHCIHCKGFLWDGSFDMILFEVLAGPAFIITFTISGVLMGFLADRSSHIFISIAIKFLTFPLPSIFSNLHRLIINFLTFPFPILRRI